MSSPNLLALVGALWLAGVLQHRAVNELADRARILVGPERWPWVAGGVGIVAMAFVAYGLAGLAARTARPAWWRRRLLALAGVVLGTTILLFSVSVEWVHYLQYGALGALVTVAVGADRAPVAFGVVTLAGALDEAFQWAVLYRERDDLPLDLPDMGINLVGALVGVLAATVWREARGARAPDDGPPAPALPAPPRPATARRNPPADDG